ncbi:MAG: FAD binding domain-containing protein [Bacteroidetes bacterium]|nr:FAD binding domain-containing protein [Bacteroidota bacterium]MBU1681016.1 FAD binding domain-containing protein [Bacteroidota bacterium]
MIHELKLAKPSSLDEVKRILSSENSKIIAGGTDIVPGFHIESVRFKNISSLIDINSIAELKEIKIIENEIQIGSAATFSSIVNSKIISENLPLLAKAASQIGSKQIRNRATIAGNFINNAPCSDSIPPLLVYDAEILLESEKEKRRIPLAEFLVSSYKTKIQPNEILTKIIIPNRYMNFHGLFYKLGRRRGVAISRITFAVLVRLENEIVTDFKFASGAITPIGKRFHEIEKTIIGKRVNEIEVKLTSRNIGEEILNITGVRWSTTYKIPVLQQAVYQSIKKLLSGN